MRRPIPQPGGLRRMVLMALREDVGGDDITTRLTVDPGAQCRARGHVRGTRPGGLGGASIHHEIAPVHRG